ncbi:Uma2 family endonuclease [Nocardia sp. NPDC051030]|uniref:Uma2 family endonuclease n=1 Tax=Nocardia sp. NPDC051030 TaxID=3155162 RepID=UPI003432098D
MTPDDQDPGLTTTEFETIAHIVERETEGVQLEYIAGRMSRKALPDGTHGRILIWLLLLLVPSSPGLFLHLGQGLRLAAYRDSRARPDGVVAPLEAFVGCGEWASPEAVVMAVEVTSRDSDTNQRDRVDKPRAYAQSGIPLYLLIDRTTAEVIVYSEPDSHRYQLESRYAFGRPVPLPKPLDITLDTAPLQDWVD